MRESLIVLGVCLVVCVGTAYGQILITHSGANDPETEGWGQSYYDYNGNWSVEARPLASDPAFPEVAAWQIEADNGEISYGYELTGEEQAAASA